MSWISVAADVSVKDVSSIKEIYEFKSETELTVVAYVNPSLENNPEKE